MHQEVKADIKRSIEDKAETDKNNIMPGKKKRTVTLTKTKSSGKVVKRKITHKAAVRKIKRRGGTVPANTSTSTLTGIGTSRKPNKKKIARTQKRAENFRQEARVARKKLRMKKKKTGNKNAVYTGK
jgi:hypothetical protein